MNTSPSPQHHRYWFKRKRYGWGWEPATWEGWLTLGIFFVLLFGNLFIRHMLLVEEPTGDVGTRIVVETIALFVALFVICARTGEKPRWQWGTRVEDDDITEPH